MRIGDTVKVLEGALLEETLKNADKTLILRHLDPFEGQIGVISGIYDEEATTFINVVLDSGKRIVYPEKALELLKRGF